MIKKPTKKVTLEEELAETLKTNLGTNPTEKWDIEKPICTLRLKDPEKTIQGKPFPANPEKRKELSRQCDELLKKGLIR